MVVGNLGVVGIAGVLATPIAMYKISEIDGRNPIIWTIITILLTGLSIHFVGGALSGPIAFVVSFVSMWIYKVSRGNLYD